MSRISVVDRLTGWRERPLAACTVVLVAIAACVAMLGVLAFAPSALAGKGGSPNPNSCGVGSAEAHDMKADPTKPGASEITNYPPVAFGCTGVTK